MTHTNRIFSYDGENWKSTSVPQYRYDEDAANMALYQGLPVMIGAMDWVSPIFLDDPNDWRSNASYFEIFNLETEEWSDLKRNPFFPELTRHYWEGTSVTKENSFLVFGGELGVYKKRSSIDFIITYDS